MAIRLESLPETRVPINWAIPARTPGGEANTERETRGFRNRAIYGLAACVALAGERRLRSGHV